MDFHVRIDAPRAGIRRFVLFIAVPIAMVLVTAFVARAMGKDDDLSWIASGQKVSATSFHTVLNDIQGRLDTLENAPAPQVNLPVFCAATATLYDGGPGGYRMASLHCQDMNDAQGCGGASSAHMCTAQELLHTVMTMGDAAIQTEGWYSTGVFSINAAQSSSPIQDCGGWQSNSSMQAGPDWASGTPQWSTCNNKHSILCCK